ncbi:MAG: beta-glucosidase, partial [Clostridiales bacterium]|nr:beta-glucosidase [Clostridiales bacterium]
MDRRTPPQIRTAANPDGPTLCYAAGSGVGILERDGLYFKDLEKDGRLHPYEDWRLPAAERAADLASRLSVEEIAGLMQYSMHQMVPGQGDSLADGNVLYAGKPFQESRLPPCALSDQQIQILKDEFVRHVLVAVVRDASTSARWNNRMQAMAESLPHGIPVNISSDPRHGMDSSKEFNAGAGGDISHWPEQIGLGATFDPDLVEKVGEIAAKEYRALGIATALS